MQKLSQVEQKYEEKIQILLNTGVKEFGIHFHTFLSKYKNLDKGKEKTNTSWLWYDASKDQNSSLSHNLYPTDF